MQELEYIKYDLGEFENRIKSLSNLKDFCYIVHDKCRDENNELKKPHLHCILTFTESTKVSVLSNKFDIPMQYFNKIRDTVNSAKAYLIHLNDDSKYQYSVDEVSASFNYSAFIEKLKSKNNKKIIAEKISNGEIKEYNLLNYITVDDYAKNKQYYTRCFEYRQNTISKLNRDLECIFITGSSGLGKTTFAKEYCAKLGYSTYISSGGNNLFDDYKGQAAIILDDLRGSAISFSDLLKLTDNNTNSLVGCRFYNKSIFECKLLIITSTLPIEKFYSKLFSSENEEIKQLYRRFPLYIKMCESTISFNIFQNDCYLEEFLFDNYITEKYKANKQKSINTVNNIAKLLNLKESEQYIDMIF